MVSCRASWWGPISGLDDAAHCSIAYRPPTVRVSGAAVAVRQCTFAVPTARGNDTENTVSVSLERASITS